MASIAILLQQAASIKGLGMLPVPSGKVETDWPIFCGHLPSKPDDAIVFTDTQGPKDGRYMSGPTIFHPGWQLRVRSKRYDVAMAKVVAIQTWLDTILRERVEVDGVWYIIQAITQTSDVLSLGQEPDSARRYNLTLNGTSTFEKE